MEIYIFNPLLELEGIIETYFSLTWTRRYSKCGEFYLHASADNLHLIKRGNILWKGDEAGYIEAVFITLDRLGRETIKVRGRFLPGYLSQRIVWGIETITGRAETGIRSLVYNHAISPSDLERAIPLLRLGDDSGSAVIITTQTSYGNLLDTVEKISAAAGLGFKCTVERGEILFTVYEGITRTAGSDNPAIFSIDFENILEQSYTDSVNDYKNVGLVAGAGEGDERKRVTVGQSEGLARYERYIDARDLSPDNLTESEYEDILAGRGEIKLAEHREIKTFDGVINPQGNLEYKVDFDLGDIVTCVSKKWGVTINARITEISEIYESATSINITFGDAMPTITDLINRVVSE